MNTYEINESVSITGEKIQSITLIAEDGTRWSIPEDSANTDYQAYLASLEETA